MSFVFALLTIFSFFFPHHKTLILASIISYGVCFCAYSCDQRHNCVHSNVNVFLVELPASCGAAANLKLVMWQRLLKSRVQFLTQTTTSDPNYWNTSTWSFVVTCYGLKTRFRWFTHLARWRRSGRIRDLKMRVRQAHVSACKLIWVWTQCLIWDFPLCKRRIPPTRRTHTHTHTQNLAEEEDKDILLGKDN